MNNYFKLRALAWPRIAVLCCDIKTRIIPDKVHMMIVLVTLIRIDWIPSILRLLLVSLVKNGSMGGGDIEFFGACSFYSGLSRGFLGSCLGLALGILTNMVYFRYKWLDYYGTFALVPYLVIRYVFSYTMSMFSF